MGVHSCERILRLEECANGVIVLRMVVKVNLRNQKPGRLAELLVEHFERVLGPDVEIKSPERIRGRNSGKRREVDVTLRARVGGTDILIAIECRDRKPPQDVRWIEELASKISDVGADVMIAVSTSGFTDAATRLAAANRILLRNLKQITEEDVERWFVRTRLSVPRCQYIGAVIVTKEPGRLEFAVTPEDQGPCLHIPPLERPRTLREFWEPIPEQLITSAACIAQIPQDGSKRLLTVVQTPENDGAFVRTEKATYPLAEVQAGFVLWMEALDPAEMDARQYGDDEGVLAQMSSYVYPNPNGYWALHITETPLEGEKYLFKYKDSPSVNKHTEQNRPES